MNSCGIKTGSQAFLSSGTGISLTENIPGILALCLRPTSLIVIKISTSVSKSYPRGSFFFLGLGFTVIPGPAPGGHHKRLIPLPTDLSENIEFYAKH